MSVQVRLMTMCIAVACVHDYDFIGFCLPFEELRDSFSTDAG